MKLTKEQKQKNLFRTLCNIYDRNKKHESLQITRNGITYTCIDMNVNDETIEKIRSWIKDENI